MNEKEILREDVSVATTLPEAMLPIIEQLNSEKKFSAVHTYSCVLRSFMRFMEEEVLTIEEVFQAGRLKEYEGWLRGRKLSWNTVSTYMRTLQAVYNRIVLPGVVGYNPKVTRSHLFKRNKFFAHVLLKGYLCIQNAT